MAHNESGMPRDGFVKIDPEDALSLDIAINQLPGKIAALCNMADVTCGTDHDFATSFNCLDSLRLIEKVLQRTSPAGASIQSLKFPARSPLHQKLAATADFTPSLSDLEGTRIA